VQILGGRTFAGSDRKSGGRFETARKVNARQIEVNISTRRRKERKEGRTKENFES
jgi:hypothetical protein